MAIISVIFNGVNYLGIITLLALIVYLGYWFVIAPYMKRKYFNKFKDVWVSPKFIPLYGDFKQLKEDYMDKGKFPGTMLRDICLRCPEKKAYLIIFGMDDFLYIRDPALLSEFQKLVPHVIDREPIDTKSFGRVGGTGGFGQEKTNDYLIKRRETLIKTIGVNFSSRFIPIFLRHCKQEINEFKEGQTVDMSELSNTIAFEIICEILFGEDIRHQLDLANYIHPEGKVEKVRLYECLAKISKDCSVASLAPVNLLFPFLIEYGIGKENKRNNLNSYEYERIIRDICERSKDTNSVYNQILNTGEFTKELLFKDLMIVLFGGYETASRSLCGALFELKKNPIYESRLKNEIHEILLENGKYTIEDLNSILTMEKLDELEFLSCFVKEVLRHDPPSARSLGYIAKANCKLGEIEIPKGQILTINIYSSHYNKDQWIEPEKFLPERFDPNSKYFKTPEGKPRSPIAWCPFTFGVRTCPGRSLGLMEIKILLIYFILGIDYEIDQKYLDDDDVIFSIMSPYSLNIKIKAVHLNS